jgi:hypothetical protein
VADLHEFVTSTFAPPVVGARFTVGFIKYILSSVVTLRYV